MGVRMLSLVIILTITENTPATRRYKITDLDKASYFHKSAAVCQKLMQ